ncbi:HD domain-containing protein [Marinomonas fungiae]|uniref:HD superfamily phosphodieaserase, includes HD domain of RNase Y n=1 Tax=Marinomonas fungiae TaxID=1137284 RepID=A0A0K6IP66_9GAMM|nr:HD domain-containing protein [Marinomonas fungiae]CUB04889.1 HD superfamily phosphodieaserase, includes HD domain of RNase Y [Marinomonas fungiae]
MRELKQLEQRCKEFVLESMTADSAHDLAHIERVVALAKGLAATEQANQVIVVAAAWLHDLVNYPKDDPKRAQASFDSATKAEAFLKSLGLNGTEISAIQHAIVTHSFSAQVTPRTLEAKVVQDADRLDALGAIGIARCMMVGGRLDRALYDSFDPFCEEREPNDLLYTLDHFFQKLLCLENTFQTDSGQLEAARRTAFMREYLAQLKAEIFN